MDEYSSLNINKKVEVHAIDLGSFFHQVVPVAVEHGFSGIVTCQGRVASLRKALNLFASPDNDIKIIAAIDFPFGHESTDARAYQIHSAKENGADAVEVVAAYKNICVEEYRDVVKDLENLILVAERCKIEFRYVIDCGCEFVNEKSFNVLAKELRNHKVACVSTSLGFYDMDVEINDYVLWMREIKRQCETSVKAFLDYDDVASVAALFKSGADVVGLDWQLAAKMLYDYEDLLRNENKPS